MYLEAGPDQVRVSDVAGRCIISATQPRSTICFFKICFTNKTIKGRNLVKFYVADMKKPHSMNGAF